MSRMGGGKSLIYNHLRRVLTLKSYPYTPAAGSFSQSAGVSVSYISTFYSRFMKKVFLFATAAIAALAMVSCNKEIEIQDQIAEGICPDGYYVEELVAEYPHDPETRTAFNEDTGKFAWTEGDELAFHLSNGEYTSAAIDPGTGKVKLYLPVGVTRDNYAVYPASAVVDNAAAVGNMKVVLPDSYDISADPTSDFVPTPLVATNDAENKHLKFEHVGGLLQVTLNVPAGVKTAKVSMGKQITGTFTLEDGTGNGIIAPGAASSDDGVTFVLSESGLAEATEVKLLTPLPSGSYDLFKVEYDNGYEFSKNLSANPWTFGRSGGKKVTISEDNFDDVYDYFWFEALEDNCSVYLTDYKANTSRGFLPIYYSFDKKEWHLWEYTIDASNSNRCTFETINLTSTGDKVWFYGECTGQFTQSTMTNYPTLSVNFHGEGRLACGGIITSLVRKDLSSYTPSAVNQRFGTVGGLFNGMSTLEDASELILPDDCYDYFDKSGGMYSYLFYNCTALKDEGVPRLPANLVRNCLGYMFAGCHSLTKTPELPANSLAELCYQYMFASCPNLEEITELPATDLAKDCYYSMFYNCSNLTTVCPLPATVMAEGSYRNMFEKCSRLEDAPELPATSLAPTCYHSMFRDCVALKNIPAILPSEEAANNCYTFMFRGCTSLEQAPVLSAKVLGMQSYSGMFYGCTALKNVPDLVATTTGSYSCHEMFKNCTALVNAPALPATILGDRCYMNMFEGCESLVNAPALPAETIEVYAYSAMFKDCVSLAIAPSLSHVISFGEYACSYMFQGCTSLCSASDFNCDSVGRYGFYFMFNGCSQLLASPKIQANQIGDNGCNSMFQSCTSITTAGELTCTNLGQSAYSSMFYGCRSLLESPELPATTAAKRCYSQMFMGCSAMTKAAPIHITTTAESFASNMFKNCSVLKEVTVYFTTWPKTSNSNDTSYWLQGVATSGVFKKPTDLEVSRRGDSTVPSGWTLTNL